ncbi:MAG TPA: cation transporter [Candidatus Marinimicrobia bacterium]|nr:cation transporter [Candidatus Neomarinimicrobiota bacterium]
MKACLFAWVIPQSLRLKEDRGAVVRTAYGRLEGWISVGINILLFMGKLIVGLLINSIALIADAFHSLSDVSTSVIVILGYRISAKPADHEHPFGHQRAEYVATLVLAVFLVVAGIEFIKSSYGRLISPRLSLVTWGVLGFVVATILVKAWLGGFAAYIGKKINSAALRADALHHYTDSVSSILVLIAIFGAKLGYPFLDGVGGMAVGLLLIWAGISIARDAADMLMGKAPTPECVAEIQEICRGIHEVRNTHDTIVHSYGDQKFISVHVEVDQKSSSLKAHDIATKVEHELTRRLNAYAVVHVDPIDLQSPEMMILRKLIDNFISASEEIREIHDLRLIKQKDHKRVFFDIVPVRDGIENCDDLEDCQKLIKLIKRDFPDFEIKIHIDQMYTYN